MAGIAFDMIIEVTLGLPIFVGKRPGAALSCYISDLSKYHLDNLEMCRYRTQSFLTDGIEITYHYCCLPVPRERLESCLLSV